MSSGHKKELTTTSTSKSGGATVIGETHLIPPDCEDLLLAVTTDDSVSGAVNAILEVSVDGVNWTEGKTRTGGSAGVPAQIAHGAVTMPSLTASAGTQVCTITYAGGALGDSPTYTIEVLNDTDNTPGDHTYYHLRNTTTGGSPAQSISGVTFGDAVVLQTHGSAFSFPDGYQHDKVTVKVTESTNGLTSEVQIGTAELGIYRRAPATITIDNYQDPMLGNAVTGAHICDIEPAGGADAGSVVTYDLVITENSGNAGPDTDLSYFKMKYGSTESTYNSSASPKTITLNNVPEGTTVQLQVVGDKAADGSAGSANWYFTEAKVFKLDIKCTESSFDQEVTATIDDINVNATVTYANDKYWKTPTDDLTHRWLGGTSQGDPLFANMGTNNVGAPDSNEAFSVSFWTGWQGSSLADVSNGAKTVYIMSAVQSLYTHRLIIELVYYGSTNNYARCRPKIWFYSAGASVNLSISSNTYNYFYSAGWTHYVMTKKATTDGNTYAANDVVWYRNGVVDQAADPTGAWGDFAFADVNHAVSGVMFNSTGAADWAWDEYAVWDRALTADEVTAIYNSGTPINVNDTDVGGSGEDTANGLVQYWRMGDADGDDHNSMKDWSDNANAVDLELNDYSGSETDMIKDH